MKWQWCISLVASLALVPGTLLAQAPKITHTKPLALAPGQTVDLTIFGENLAESTGVWTDFPAKWELAPGIENNGKLANQVTYRFTTPRNVQVGFGAVRITTGQGTSNLKLIMLDDLSTTFEQAENRSLESAHEISIPTAVDGQCDERVYDYYSFQVEAGQTLSAEVVAQRMGSLMDPDLSLMDSMGQELNYADDDPCTGADGRLVHQFETAGRYAIRVKDVRHRGGVGYVYRLRLGRFPLASVAYPLGGQSGSVATFSIAGPAVSGLSPVNVLMPDASGQLPMFLSVRYPGADGSGYVAVVTGSNTETLEVEPNDQAENATTVTVPCAINGRFNGPEDRDLFQFEVKKGQRLLFRGRARDLGSPSDLYMRLSKSDGAQLAEIEDSGSHEGLIDYTFPEDGTYRLTIEDLFHFGGEENVYRVEVEWSKPGFTLALEGESFNVPCGGTLVTKVTSVRRHFEGPIELYVEGTHDGLKLEGQVIPEKKNETQLKLTLPSSHEPGQMLALKVVGRAKIDDEEFIQTAGTLDAIRKVIPTVIRPPHSLDGVVAVGVGPVFPSFFELSVDDGTVNFPQLVGASSYRVKLKRLNDGFKEPISVAIEGLPEGFSAEVKPVDKGEAEYEVIQKGPESLPEGVHEIRIVGTGTFQNQTQKVVLEKVPLKVIKPLFVALTLDGPIAPGNQQIAKIQITRFGEEKNPVTVRWKDGPAGVVAPIQLTVPGDKNELEVPLQAAPDAPHGIFDNLVAVASTQVKGQEITVESSPTQVEIKP